MTQILNFITHIGSYFGIGMVMLILGLVAIIVAAVKLSKMRKADRNRTVAEFNQRFAMDTGSKISEIDAASRRREIAKDLRISGPNN